MKAVSHNSLATRSKKRSRQTRPACVNVRHPPLENSCGCTALDMMEWKQMTEQIDWWAKQPSQAACASENLKCCGAWDTKPKTWHYWLLGGERSRKRKCLMIFLERMRKGHCQSDKHWNTFRQHWVKTSDWWGGAHMGLPKPIDTTLNSTELNRSHITGCSICLSKSFD